MTVSIFGLLLPLAVWLLPSRTSTTPVEITLNAARVSIIPIGIGALFIGLAGSLEQLLPGSPFLS